MVLLVPYNCWVNKWLSMKPRVLTVGRVVTSSVGVVYIWQDFMMLGSCDCVLNSPIQLTLIWSYRKRARVLTYTPPPVTTRPRVQLRLPCYSSSRSSPLPTPHPVPLNIAAHGSRVRAGTVFGWGHGGPHRCPRYDETDICAAAAAAAALLLHRGSSAACPRC